MWYLYGLIISFLIFIVLISVRYRSYWNRTLKDSRAQNQEPLDMLGEHIVCSLFIFRCLTYEEYKDKILHPASFDTFDLCLFTFLLLLLMIGWMITVPLLVIICIFSTFIKFLQKSINKKIQKNSQSE